MDIIRLTAFRHEMHQNPESAFEEYETQKRIRSYLELIGVQDIRICARTGLVANLRGSAPSEGEDRLIAFRADIDALILQEANLDLPYRSKNNRAHMCGHDGHTTMLLGFAELFQQQSATIPSNKVIRLLFQPGEESAGGAVDMIEDGCLEGVQEVYGCHQWPTGKIGQVWCREGSMMSQPIQITITINGRGGHASEPHKFINPVQCGADFLYIIHKRLSEIKGQFTFAFTCFEGGTVMNVIPDKATLKGMVRSLEAGLGDKVFEIIQQTLHEICTQFGCTSNVLRQGHKYTLTANTSTEAQHVLRLGNQFFGEGNANDGPCPVYASEDFGNYTLKVPGAFFFLSSGKNEQGNPQLHQSDFNFNDDLIPLGAEFWFRLAKDRLLI